MKHHHLIIQVVQDFILKVGPHEFQAHVSKDFVECTNGATQRRLCTIVY